jgi:hypothetical protein
MFTMFVLTRMAVRVVVFGAFVATVISVVAAFEAPIEVAAIESYAAHAIHWLVDQFDRLADAGPSIGDITLADLTSPQGWIDLGAGLFGGGEQPAEIDPRHGAPSRAPMTADG